MKDRREQNDYHNLITPCYVIHNDILQDGIDLLKTSLDKYWNNYIVGYSFKTNSLPYIIGVMRNAGFHAEVVSEDEYLLACKYGFRNIIYNGPVTAPSDVRMSPRHPSGLLTVSSFPGSSPGYPRSPALPFLSLIPGFSALC